MRSQDDFDGEQPGHPGSDEVARLVHVVCESERLIAEAVDLAGRLAGVAEAERGMPVEQVLLVACRLTGADRHTLVTAAEVVADMACLHRLFHAGEVSWGQVRGICRHAKGLSRADRGWLDDRLAATIAERGGLACFDPDDLIRAAGDAVAELADQRRAERDERHGIESSFLSLQPDFFGGVRAYGELDAHLAAPLLDALQTASPAPHAGQAHHRNDDGDQGPDGDGEAGAARAGWTGPSRSRQHAVGLWRIATEWLAGQPASGDGAALTGVASGDGGAGATGGSGTGRRARPQLVVHVPLAQATTMLAGHVDLAARGPLPRLTAAAVEALACSGDVKAVVFDGAQPLATTKKMTAAAISEATRQGVEARDLGCRWPGCQAPLVHTEIHHLIPVSRGGTHEPENLVCLCRIHHLQAHGRGWTLTIDSESGTVAGWRHGRRKWTTLPPATPLAHPDPPADGRHGDGHPFDGRDPPAGDAFLDHEGNPLPF